MIPRNVFAALTEIVLEGGAKRATKYISEKLTVKATVRSKSKLHTELVFTIGRPNYAEREFIKACKRAGESFPVKKVQIQWPKKRKR